MRILIFTLIFMVHFQVLISQETYTLGGMEMNSNGIIFNSEEDLSLLTCDTIFSFDNVFDFSGGLAWDGSGIWTNGYLTEVFYKFNTSGDIIDSIPAPPLFSLGGLDFDGEHLLSVDEQLGILYKLNPETGAIVTQFELPFIDSTDKNNSGVVYDGTYIWNSYYRPGRLFKLNAETGEVLNTFELAHNAFGLLINGDNLLVLGGSIQQGPELVYTFDTELGMVVDSAELCDIYFTGITSDGDDIWLPSPFGGNKKIYKFFGASFPFFITDTDDLLEDHYNDLAIYPNPTNDMLTIMTPDFKAVRVFNTWGKEIKKSTTNNIVDLSGQATGIYFAIIDLDGMHVVRKIVKI